MIEHLTPVRLHLPRNNTVGSAIGTGDPSLSLHLHVTDGDFTPSPAHIVASGSGVCCGIDVDSIFSSMHLIECLTGLVCNNK